ncbi:MAG: uncharacterized protein V7606_5072 [Burkholderiales bacterium]
MKILLWVAVGLAIVAWLMRSKKTPKRPEASRPPVAAQAEAGEIEPMVQCVHCGVHIPVSESVVDSQGSAYCSDEHRRLHA